jgi:acetylornithine/succinyldiaminopimelate/putrescine aminotransferase
MSDSVHASHRVSEILRTGFEDFARFVNPLVAQRTTLTGEPAHVVSTKNGQLVDAEGRTVEDFHGTQSFGHRQRAVTDAVRAFLDSDSPSWFPSRVNPYAGSLARRLCELTGYSNAFFASSGSEAVEAALKLARAVTRRPRVLSLEGAYHGCTMGSCGLMTKSVFRDLFEPHLPGVGTLPFGDLGALEAALSAGDVAAVIAEPIQLEGGVRTIPAEYLTRLCELAERHGTLLVADEVQTGLGRSGRGFLASSTWPRRPDAVVFGKHLGGGLLPLSAMLTSRELFDRAYGRNFETAEAHNCTFSGSAMVCVAGHAALDLITDASMERIRTVGAAFRSQLRESLQGLPLFKEIRGEGLIFGIALTPTQHPWLSFDHFGMEELGQRPTVGLLLCHRLYRRGYFCFVCGLDWTVLRVLPRFDIPEETLAGFGQALREELTFLSELD